MTNTSDLAKDTSLSTKSRHISHQNHYILLLCGALGSYICAVNQPGTICYLDKLAPGSFYKATTTSRLHYN